MLAGLKENNGLFQYIESEESPSPKRTENGGQAGSTHPSWFTWQSERALTLLVSKAATGWLGHPSAGPIGPFLTSEGMFKFWYMEWFPPLFLDHAKQEVLSLLSVHVHLRVRVLRPA